MDYPPMCAWWDDKDVNAITLAGERRPPGIGQWWGIPGARRVFDSVLSKNPVLFGVTAENVDTLNGYFKDLLGGKPPALGEVVALAGWQSR